MRVLKEITIKNYRAIKDVSFKANSINLIIGPNNTGKSSILEAIALLLSSDSGFKDLLIKHQFIMEAAEDLINYLHQYRGYYLEYLIRLGSSRAEIEGIVGKKSWKLALEYYEEGMPGNGDNVNLIKQYVEKKITKHTLKYRVSYLFWINESLKEKSVDLEKLKSDIVKNLIEQPKLFLTLRKNREISRKFAYFPSMEIKESLIRLGLEYFWDHSMEIYSGRSRRRHIKLVADLSRTNSSAYVREIYDFAVEKGLIKEIVEFLKERIPYITDINRTAEDIYITFSENKRSLPLSSMGDGFISLLRLGFLVALTRGGVIVWEEPENYLHPKFLEILAEAIVSYAEDAQFFIGTHSLDLLNYVLEKAAESKKLKEINIIRLHYRGDTKTVEAEVMDGLSAKDEIDEIGTDLRIT